MYVKKNTEYYGKVSAGKNGRLITESIPLDVEILRINSIPQSEGGAEALFFRKSFANDMDLCAVERLWNRVSETDSDTSTFKAGERSR